MATAGNKSLLPYRLGVGCPGYTGFTPAPENIAIPVKSGAMERASLERGTGAHGDGGTIVKPGSTTVEDFTLTPADFALATMPNPLWDIKSKRNIGDPPFVQRPVDPLEGKRPFYGTSTFRESYDKGLHGAEYPMNVTQTGRLRPPGAKVAEKKDPFYTTEAMHRGEDTAQLLAMRQHVHPPGPEVKELANRDVYTGVALHAAPMSTTYRDAHGPFGVNPYDNLPQAASEIKFRSSTLENFKGTTKASYHPPGYSGFVPETGKNPRATEQGMCVKPRVGTKNIELCTLFQYPHQLPGYAGFRTQAPINDVGPKRDNQATTTGRVMASGTNNFEPGDLGLSMQTLAPTAPMRSVHGKQGSLYQEIFSQESIAGNLSDNGKNEAETYYHRTRPYEGRSVAIIKQGHWSQY